MRAPQTPSARQTNATTLPGRKRARLQPFGVSRALTALMGCWRRSETRFELRDSRLELLELFARLQQHLGLRIEFRTRHNVELGETALQHRFHVFFDVLRRRVLDGLADPRRQFVERVAVQHLILATSLAIRTSQSSKGTVL